MHYILSYSNRELITPAIKKTMRQYKRQKCKNKKIHTSKIHDVIFNVHSNKVLYRQVKPHKLNFKTDGI